MSNQLTSRVDKLDIISASGEATDLSGGFLGFRYYESLFSPHITAYLTVFDTGSSVKSSTDKQERPADIVSAIPIKAQGKELLNIVLCHKTGRLSFGANNATDYGLRVVQASTETQKSKTMVEISLVSQVAEKNKTSVLSGAYGGLISNSASKIFNSLLGSFPSRSQLIDKTKNSLDFKGSQIERPFNKLIDLATQSISSKGKGSPGYFIFETQDGLNFKSAQEMANAEHKFTYEVGQAQVKRGDGDFKIVQYQQKSEFNLLKSYTCGSLGSLFCQWSPLTGEYKEYVFKPDENTFETMGSEGFPTTASLSNTSFIDSETIANYRTYAFITNDGNSKIGLSTERNNDPFSWAALSSMRYNSLFNQAIDIIVPMNLQLRVGQTIRCEFPRTSKDNPEQGVLDQSRSGKYLILHLGHHFTNNPQTGSTTHMTIIRDTNGLHKGAGEE